MRKTTALKLVKSHSENHEFPGLVLSPDQRYMLWGKTGSGKTVLEQWLIWNYHANGWPIAIVDPKRRWNKKYPFSRHEEQSTILKPYKSNKDYKAGIPVQIYQPDGGEDLLESKRFISWLDSILYFGNVVFVLDEVYGAANEHYCPTSLRRIWTEGRDLNIPAIAGSQEPTHLPTFMYTQNENFCILRLNSEEHREKAAKLIGDEEVLQIIPPHYWWYYNENFDDAYLMKPVPLLVPERSARNGE